MKKAKLLWVLLVLGAVTLSCEDSTYNEVENVVLDQQSSNTIDGSERERDKPGSN